ncbi:hypothetical protein [Sphingomonas panni]|uniref:hypothetical protein n=1 Tax=Sphingomonas panni TaxID=237612 RepID=UPI003016DCD8
MKVPMVAMSKFLLLRATTAAASMAIGEAGMIGRAPLAAEAQRRMATRGFFVSRCKAEGGGKKPRGAVAPGRSRRSRPRLDQANREAARLSPSRKFYAVAMMGIVSRRAFASLLDRARLTSQVILRKDYRRANAADAPYVFAEIPREAGIDRRSSPAS